MNKSKFLKKSLAMILTIMMVVAMIPMGASAASVPTLLHLTVDDQVRTAENGVYKVDIAADATQVTVASELQKATLEAVRANGVDTDVIYDATTGTKGNQTLTLSNYREESGVYNITLRAISTEDNTKRATWTLQLTKKVGSTTANVKSVKVSDGGGNVVETTGVIDTAIDNTKKTVTVTVAHGTTSGHLIIVPDDNAKLAGAPANNEVAYTTAAGGSFTLTSQSGLNTPWFIVVEQKPSLTTLTIAGKSGKFEDKKNSDGINDTITVTLTEDDLKDKYDEVETNPVREITFTTLAKTTVQLQPVSPVSGTLAGVSNGGKLTLSGLTTTQNYTATVKATCKGVAFDYDLVVKVTPSKENEISYAQINKTIATIEGKNITAELPASVSLSAVPVTIRVPKGATVSGDIAFTKDGGYTSTKLDQYNTTSTANLTKAKAIVVTAADGTAVTYTISATTADKEEAATLTALSLKNGDTEYTGTISGRTVIVTVPYLTTNMSAWKVYATPNASAKAYFTSTVSDANAILNGESTAAGFGGKMAGAIADADMTVNVQSNSYTLTTPNAIVVANKVDPSVKSNYDLVVKFTAPVAGTTLTGLGVLCTTAANDKLALRGAETADYANVQIDQSKKTVTVNVAHSQNGDSKLVTSIATQAGGVPLFIDTNVKVVKAADKTNAASLTAVLTNGAKIWVLPEITARKYLVDPTKVALDAGDDKKGTEYTVTIKKADPKHDAKLSKLTIDDTNLAVGSSTIITGTIPYGLTVEAGETLGESNTHFADFQVSPFATLGTAANCFKANGDTDKDGEPNDVGATNQKFYFVRNALDNKVKVYQWDGTAGNAGAVGTEITNGAKLKVTPECAESAHENGYEFNLTYAQPNTGHEITSFKLANVNATISGREITVTVPYNTKLNGLIPVFTTSAGAKVAFGNDPVISGKTPLDFSRKVTLLVTAEDNSKTVSYTVTATVSSQFSDVPEGKWFYPYVMKAASAGIVKGNDDGTFKPYADVTRRDFALMLVRMMGKETEATASFTAYPFTDEKQAGYAAAAIAFLKNEGITEGYTDGTFKPLQNITRQEAAVLIAKALRLDGTPSEEFPDQAKVASWAKTQVNACKAAGIFGGDEKGNFNPTTNIKRNETAKVMVDAQGK